MRKHGPGITFHKDSNKPRPASPTTEAITNGKRRRMIENITETRELRKTERGNYE